MGTRDARLPYLVLKTALKTVVEGSKHQRGCVRMNHSKDITTTVFSSAPVMLGTRADIY